jgi:hypothetical protein
LITDCEFHGFGVTVVRNLQAPCSTRTLAGLSILSTK